MARLAHGSRTPTLSAALLLAALAGSVAADGPGTPATVTQNPPQTGSPCGRNCDPDPPAAPVCYSDYATTGVENFQIETENGIYASFYLDAREPRCAPRAAERLQARLSDTIAYYGSTASGGPHWVHDERIGADVHPFQTWLAGSMVTHIFAAAKELQRHDLSVDPDLLQTVETIYSTIPTPQDPGCGLKSLPWVNSCMDDFALTAAGFGWIAAYESAQGHDPDPPGSPWATLARQAIASALSPMTEHGGGPCFFVLERLADGSARARCDGQLPEAKIMGADHNRENPNYGLGLMPSIATACAGLFIAGHTCEFTDDEKVVALELLRHAQEKASPEGCEFNPPGPSGCMDFTNPEGPTLPCSDSDDLVWSQGGYRPTDFPVRLFYDHRGISGQYPAPYFQFDRYCESRSVFDPAEFWGPNRKIFYQILGYEIFEPDTTPPTVSLTVSPAGPDDPNAFSLTAHATDDLRVAGVEFLVDGQSVGRLSTPPYVLSVTVSPGVHTFMATAADDAGNVGSSKPVTPQTSP